VAAAPANLDLMVLQIGISLAAAVGLAVVIYALGTSRVTASALSVLLTFAAILLFTINVGAGPVIRHGVSTTCQIINAAITQPADCRPRGLGGQPVRIAGKMILLGNGSRLPIVSGRVRSFIETSQMAGNLAKPAAQLTGWAASVRESRPATAVLVFSSGRFLGAVAPTISRPDVARFFHDPALRVSGFILNVPLPAPPAGSRTPGLRLFALSQGVVSPMAFDCAQAIKQFGC
jgi:hypothetical protein